MPVNVKNDLFQGITGKLKTLQRHTTLEGNFWNSSLIRRPEGSACDTKASKSCSNNSFKLPVEV